MYRIFRNKDTKISKEIIILKNHFQYNLLLNCEKEGEEGL